VKKKQNITKKNKTVHMNVLFKG